MKVAFPPDWSTPELGTFAKATGGSRFPPASQGSTEGDYPFYKVSDMNLSGNERFMGRANNWVTEETCRKIKARTFPKGSVIFPKIGAAVATNKKRLLSQESIIDNNVMAVVVENPETCTSSYLRFWFDTIDLRDLSNSGTLPSIPGHRVHAIRVPLPPLPEQKKIAHILSTVQRAIEAQERIIQTTTELKKALMHKLFTEGLRNEPQKQTEIGPIPESWEVAKVGDVAKIQSGGTPTRDVPANWVGGTIPWVKTGEIDYCMIKDTEEKITPIGLRNSAARLYPTGTVLMAMYGQGITRGRVGLLGIEAATNQACASITPTNTKRISATFLYYYFQYHYENLRTLGHGANQRNMNAALIRSFPVSFPEPNEQASVVAALESIDVKSELHERKRQQLQDLFRSLLHDLITAKVRVQRLELVGKEAAA